MLFNRITGFSILLVMLLLAGCGASPDSTATTENKQTGFVSIYVNYGKAGDRTIEDLTWKEGMTVWEAMIAAEDRGDLKIDFKEYPGLGKYILALDEVQQSENAGIYWRLCINNVNSTLGVEKQELRPGQTVEWYLAYESPCDKAGAE